MPTSTGPKYEIIGSEDLQRQIELLKFYPEIFDRYFYPALQHAAELVKEGIRGNLGVRHTGQLGNALGSKIIGGTANPLSSKLGTMSALGTRAEIGFGKRYGMPSATYAAALNQGAVAHEIVGGRKPKGPADGLIHFSSGTRFTAIGSIQHPGFSGRHFMEAGLAEATPGIDALMDTAAGKVVEELAKP
jgi:hypothetical protein